MNKVKLMRHRAHAAKLLTALACVMLAGSLSAQRQKRNAKAIPPPSATQMQSAARFVEPLNVSVPPEWEQYVAEGVGKLDATGVQIARKYLANIFAALDTADRQQYMLLIAEHFRNDYRQYKKIPPEHKVTIVMPSAQKYAESASSTFDNIRTEIIDTYTREIEEINRRTQRMRDGGGGNTQARQTSYPAPVHPPVTITRAADERAAIINNEKKRFTNINERANSIDKKLTDIEHNIEHYKKRIAQLESQRTPPPAARPQRAWVRSFPAPAPKQPARVSREDQQLKEIERIAQNSEKRLAAIENRVDQSERELEIIDHNIEKIAASVAAGIQAAPPPAPTYAAPEKRAVRINQPPVSGNRGAAPKAAVRTVAAPAPSSAGARQPVAYNKFRPVNNNMGGECSMDACAAIEDWLMNWYEQYQQYPEEKRRTSRFLAALKEAKDTYDKQKLTYPKKLKFLLRKFDMLPYGM